MEIQVKLSTFEHSTKYVIIWGELNYFVVKYETFSYYKSVSEISNHDEHCISRKEFRRLIKGGIAVYQQSELY